MEEQRKYDLFDRYLRGELDETELDAFLERLKSDQEFREELDMHQILVEGIREHEREELRAYMQERARVRFMGNPWSKAWTYASAAVVVGFGILYMVINPKVQEEELAQKQKEAAPEMEWVDTVEEIAEAPKPRKKPKKAPPEENAAEPVQIPSPEQRVQVGDSMGVDPIYPGLQTEDHGGRLAGVNQEDELPVKEDTRVFDTMLGLHLEFVADSLSENAERVPEVRDENIKVQFWKSPINYKGYRFDGRTLQLFGLDTFDQVSLKYHVLNADLEVYEVYLKYGDNYYKLNDNNRYNAYLREKDPKIIQRLK